ncbi:MAG: endo alpha-1,4 polygalactosaminidase [Bacteroidia bacterium]
MKNLLYFLPLALGLLACDKTTPLPERDFAEDMRLFVQSISSNAKAQNPNFLVIPQNGQELVTTNLEGDGPLATAYLDAIDGQGREDLFYGYNRDNQATADKETTYITDFLDKAKAVGVVAVVTDYCSDQSKMDDSYQLNADKGYLSFAADERELNNIPTYPATIAGENADDIQSLSEAKNFLYLINPSGYADKNAFIQAISATNYDMLIIDAFYEDTWLTAADISVLRSKNNGGIRLVVSYMSIGEAEDYRYYWQTDWDKNRPTWLDSENPQWKGNFKVRYWEADWQAVIVGNSDSYLQKIVEAGFDGVYLDIIDAFEYFSE